MKFSYEFQRLCGSVYGKQGANVLFTQDGNGIISPVGNRVSVFALTQGESFTFPFQLQRDVYRMALAPDGRLLMVSDEDGRMVLVNFPKRVVLSHFNLGSKPTVLEFSPCGSYFVTNFSKGVRVWKTPRADTVEFAPFVLHRSYTGHGGEVTCVNWSKDSNYFVTGGRDLTARIYSLDPIPGFKPFTLAGHKEYLVGVYFNKEQDSLYAVSHDASVTLWQRLDYEDDDDDEDEPEESRLNYTWKFKDRHFFNMGGSARIKSCCFHQALDLLVVGFTNGAFGIFEMPDLNTIHTLSMTQKAIQSAAMSPAGDWLAFGSATYGQLLVWEWRSESYILKQQGHQHTISDVVYSPDGALMASGGEDGKVKLWRAATGMCYVTFTEHTSAVTAVRFSANGRAVYSSSIDGTVRAFDLARYRNFRTFTSPTPTAFSCLAVDPAGDLIAAGSQDDFNVYIWNIGTGRLLEVLNGHDGPVSGLSFHPTQTLLASSSWDHTARVWDIFESKAKVEPLPHNTDCLAVTFRPDGKELAVATLDGQLTCWNWEEGTQTANIEGRMDLAAGRRRQDLITSKNLNSGRCFTSVTYSADGMHLLCGGRSKYVCIYAVKEQILVRRMEITRNKSLDGVQDELNSKKVTEFGTLDTMDVDSGDESDPELRKDRSLPGVKSGDFSKQRVAPEIRVLAVYFAPSGESFVVSSTEGLIIFALDAQRIFDPFELDTETTPQAARAALYRQRDFEQALIFSLRLNRDDLLREVFAATPVSFIEPVVRPLTLKYSLPLLEFTSRQILEDGQLERNVIWARHLLTHHGLEIRERGGVQGPRLCVAVQKALFEKASALTKLCDNNTHTLEYLSVMATQAATTIALE
eukprot:Clim_evm10s241 gene=Clim_evmTU10s241